MAKPKDIQFFGETKAEQASSRSHDHFRLSFTEVDGAIYHEYEVKETGQAGKISNGSSIPLATTNSVFSVRIRALESPGKYSGWSDFFVSLTRPPPNILARLPFDLQGWGAVLEWTRPALGYDYNVVLTRKNRNGNWSKTFGPGEGDQFVDVSYLLNESNIFTTIVSTRSPPAKLPDGEDRNESFPSDLIEVTGPRNHVGQTVQAVVQRNTEHGERFLRNLMTGY